MRFIPRQTVRARLTALIGGVVLLAGVVFIAVNQFTLLRVLHRTFAAKPQALCLSRPELASTGVCQRLAEGVPPRGSSKGLFLLYARVLDAEIGDVILREAIISLVVLAVVALGVGYVLAGSVIGPVHRITATARKVARSSNLNQRIRMGGPDDELKELADTFDDMLDRLAQSFEGQRRFVANASHELRTPLAINRTLLEVTLADPDVSEDARELASSLLVTNERSERMIEALLLLARSENELTGRKPVDLAEVGERAVDQAITEANQRGVRLIPELGPATAFGDGVLLERLAANLVQNAIRYNVPDGWVHVRTAQEVSGAVLAVTNTGPEVPQEQLATLFEPFRRLRNERTHSDRGVGLGLSIVRSVVRVHGGRISAEPNTGGGLVMRVTLPVPPTG
jgi:signal transduction histidine kinase